MLAWAKNKTLIKQFFIIIITLQVCGCFNTAKSTAKPKPKPIFSILTKSVMKISVYVSHEIDNVILEDVSYPYEESCHALAENNLEIEDINDYTVFDRSEVVEGFYKGSMLIARDGHISNSCNPTPVADDGIFFIRFYLSFDYSIDNDGWWGGGIISPALKFVDSCTDVTPEMNGIFIHCLEDFETDIIIPKTMENCSKKWEVTYGSDKAILEPRYASTIQFNGNYLPNQPRHSNNIQLAISKSAKKVNFIFHCRNIPKFLSY